MVATADPPARNLRKPKPRTEDAPPPADLFVFNLAPMGADNPRPTSARLIEAVRYAEAHGLTVRSVTLALDGDECPIPGELAARVFLKHCGRRLGLRASWPDLSAGVDRPAAEP